MAKPMPTYGRSRASLASAEPRSLDQEDVYGYLSGAAHGFKSLPQAIGDDLAAATLPVFITGTLLFASGPRGKVVGLP
jgi:hypothetical protein